MRLSGTKIWNEKMMTEWKKKEDEKKKRKEIGERETRQQPKNIEMELEKEFIKLSETIAFSLLF